MINTKLREEYGEEGIQMMMEFAYTLTDSERDSVYVIGNHEVMPKTVPFEFVTDRVQFVNSICNKLMSYYFQVDKDMIVTCGEYNGEGIKLWLTMS